MAQTRKRRRTKHRGNAAGIVEARGRTGRRPADGKGGRGSVSASGRGGRRDRWATPPTWRGALNRAGFATVLFAVAVVALFRYPVVQTVTLAAIMLVLYVPLGYYTDLWIYNRRRRKREE